MLYLCSETLYQLEAKMPFYRNNQTGLVQHHPVSGIGDSLGSTEIGEDAKPVKPRTSKAPSADELKRAKSLMKDSTKATGSTETVDTNKQKGAK